MIKKNLTSSIILVMMLLITPCVSAQTYRQIKGWSKEVNDRLEDFLNSTITMKIRKVAVFDGDGTVMGQVPHYLADEALYQYADEHFKGKTDKFSKEKMAILNRMVKDGNNVGKPYVEDRVHFLAGLTPEEILERFYDFDTFRLNQKSANLHFTPQRLQGETAQFEIKDKEGNTIVAKDKRITARHVRLMEKAGIKEVAVPDDFLIGRVLAKAIYNQETGEKIADANDEITADTLTVLRMQCKW